MMKQLFFFFLLWVGTVTQAQDVYDTLAKETCHCIEAKKNTKTDLHLESPDMVLELGLCIIESYNRHSTAFSETEKVDFNDKVGMEKLGQNVALKMLTHCPNWVIEMTKNSIENEEELATEPFTEKTLEGQVTSIETKQFVVIKLKDKNNRIHSFLLLDYFDTAALFTEDKIKTGTSLKIGYNEVELYDPEINDFKYCKVISRLEKK